MHVQQEPETEGRKLVKLIAINSDARTPLAGILSSRARIMQQQTLFSLLICVFGTSSIHAQFTVIRGLENVTNLQQLSDLELLAIAAKNGETHIIELTDAVQGAVVQEDVTLSIDCLPWLLQNPAGYMIRWTFVQLDEFGNVRGTNSISSCTHSKHIMFSCRSIACCKLTACDLIG